MGSPLSPILAEIFMNDMENKILKGSKFGNSIKYWARYVDDILMVWTGTNRQVDLLLSEMNAMNESIKFTVEKGNETINYLDLTLTLNNNRIEYKIYRKPTHTDTIIPNDSYHHPRHKLAALQNYCHRAISVLKNNEEKRKEIEIVKQIAEANGYHRGVVEGVFRKMETKKGTHDSTVRRYSGSIPYIGKYTNKVIKAFNSYDVNVGIQNNLPMVKRISNDQTETKDKEGLSGVYKLSCEQCEGIYIGETGRKFEIRKKEHKKSREKEDGKSLFGKHCNEEHHNGDGIFEVLHVENRTKRRKLREQMEIAKAKRQKACLLNNVITFNSEKLFSLVIGREKKNRTDQ